MHNGRFSPAQGEGARGCQCPNKFNLLVKRRRGRRVFRAPINIPEALLCFRGTITFFGGEGCDEHWMLPKKGATSTSRQHPSSCVMGTTKQNQQYTKMEPADKASRVRSPTSFAFTADLNILCTDCGNRRRQLAAGLLTVVPHRGDEKHCHEP